jgi:hypothetical protein
MCSCGVPVRDTTSKKRVAQLPRRAAMPRRCGCWVCAPPAATIGPYASTSTRSGESRLGTSIPTACATRRFGEVRFPCGGSSSRGPPIRARTSRPGFSRRASRRVGARCAAKGEIWQGRRMSLILDHSNGVADENRLTNLRIVCPNCAPTLDTHCGRQNRLERGPRRCLRCEDEFWPAYAAQDYCSRYCAVRRKRDTRVRPGTRRVERPPYPHLLWEIRALGFVATGRRYGVSDNAIRKWVRAYEAEQVRVQPHVDLAGLE